MKKSISNLEVVEEFLKMPPEFLNNSDMCFKNYKDNTFLITLIGALDDTTISVYVPLKFTGNVSIKNANVIPTASFLDFLDICKEDTFNIQKLREDIILKSGDIEETVPGRGLEKDDDCFPDIVWKDGTEDIPENSHVGNVYFHKDPIVPEAEIKDVIEHKLVVTPLKDVPPPDNIRSEEFPPVNAIEKRSDIAKSLKDKPAESITWEAKEGIQKAIEMTQDLMDHLNNLKDVIQIYKDSCITVNKDQFAEGLKDLLEKSI